jgi:hypothetical protein
MSAPLALLRPFKAPVKRLFLAILILCAACSAQFTPPRGILYANNFGSWSVAMGNNGSFSWSSPSACTVSSSGISFPAFKVGTPIEVVDTNPALSESVTVTAVNLTQTGCSIVTTALINPHYSFTIQSATSGLQEAINYASGQPTTIVLTPDWTRLGGLDSTITTVQGNSNVSLYDQRANKFQAWAWNGSVYSLIGGGGSGNVLTGNQYSNAIFPLLGNNSVVGPDPNVQSTPTGLNIATPVNGSAGVNSTQLLTGEWILALVSGGVITSNYNVTLDTAFNIPGYTVCPPNSEAAGAIVAAGTMTGTSNCDHQTIMPIQGTDPNLLSSGTVSGTAAPLCTDANGGATTVGCPTSSGNVTTAVTLNTGQLVVGAGASAVGVGDLSGDVSTAGSTVTTVNAVNGTTYPTPLSINTVPVVTTVGPPGAVTYETVPVAAGGTGDATLNAHGVVVGEGTSPVATVAAMPADTILQGQGATSDPAAVAIGNCGDATHALSYGVSSPHAFGCQSLTPTALFSALGSGTNTSAAMVVGSGSSLSASGGSINATNLLGGTWASPGAIGGTSPSTAAFTNLSASAKIGVPASASFASTSTSNIGIDSTLDNLHFWNGASDLIGVGILSGAATNNDCAKLIVSSGKVTLGDAGAACGSGSGGGDSITTPQNTLNVGGTITATTLDVVGAAGKILAGATPALTANPVLGVPGTTLGSLGMAGNTSGTATIQPQAVAGSPTLTLPNTTGTLADGGTAPLAVNTTTGSISIQNSSSANVTSSLGTDTKIFTASGSAAVTGDLIEGDAQGGIADSGNAAPQSLANASHKWLNSYTASTGAYTQTQPAISDLTATISSPLTLTANTLACPTCVTSSGGGAITGTAPVAVSAAGAVSLQNSAGTNVTAALGTDIKYSTWSGSAAVQNDIPFGDAQGGYADSGSSVCGPAAVCAIHLNGTVTSYFASSNTNAARGAALLVWQSACADGDQVYLAAGTFDLGSTNTLDLSCGYTATTGIGLHGASSTSTTVVSEYVGVAKVVLNLGNNAVVENFTLTATSATSPNYTYPIGQALTGSSHNFTGAIIRNMIVNGQTDDLYVTTNNCTYTVIDSTFNSAWDNFNALSNQGNVGNFYNDTFISTASGTYTGNAAACLRSSGPIGGTSNVFNVWSSTCTISGQTNANYGIYAGGGGGIGVVFNVYGGSFTATYASGGVAYALDNAGGTGGALNITSDVIASGQTANTTGTITYIGQVQPPSLGGTGVANPTAHNIPLAEGSSNFNLLSLNTDQYVSGVTGADPVAGTFVPCGDATHTCSYAAGSGGAGTWSNVALNTGSPALANVTAVTANANSTSPQQLQEIALTAGYLNTLTAPVHFHSSGIFSTTGTPTITLTERLCTVSGCGSGTVVPLAVITSTATVSGANNEFSVNFDCGVTATGASGNLICHGAGAIDLTSASVTSTVFSDGNTAVSSNINLTGALYFDTFVTFSSGSTSNTMTNQLSYVAPVGIGNPAFSSITTGTNTTATMTLGSGSTLNLSGTGKIDLSAGSVGSAFKPPAAAGANPSTAGVCAFNTTSERLVCGDNATTQTYLTGTDRKLEEPFTLSTYGTALATSGTQYFGCGPSVASGSLSSIACPITQIASVTNCFGHLSTALSSTQHIVVNVGTIGGSGDGTFTNGNIVLTFDGGGPTQDTSDTTHTTALSAAGNLFGASATMTNTPPAELITVRCQIK